MTLKHLRIFSEVCRMGSVTKAAEELNMAQPAVTNAIRELEGFYQVKLFERMNRRLYITNAGEYLRGYADSILLQFEESKDILQDIAASTKIRVGSNVSFGANDLPKLIADFGQVHPEIPIFTMIQNSSHIEDCLLHNELDFAIVDNLSGHAGIQSFFLKEESMVALCSPDFAYFPAFSSGYPHTGSIHTAEDIRPVLPSKPALSITDFEKIPLLVREAGSGSRDMLDKVFRQQGIEPRIALESISTQVLIDFCLRGLGILFLTKGQAAPYLSSGKLLELPVTDAEFKRNYYFIYHQKKYLTKSMHYFLDYIIHAV